MYEDHTIIHTECLLHSLVCGMPLSLYPVQTTKLECPRMFANTLLANRSRPPVGIHDVEPTPRHRCKMAVFHHFTSTCLSRYIPICKRKPNDDRVESKEPTFCFQVVPNPLPHAGQVIQPASDVCQIPEQRFTDLPVSALPSRPPALRYNQPPTLSQTLPLADMIPDPLLVHVLMTINVPTLKKPCRFNGSLAP